MKPVAVFVLDMRSGAGEGSGSGPSSGSDSPLAATVHRVDPATPVLSVQDAGATRGDGVFETVGVMGGSPQAVEAHLERLARSAALLDLPAPDLDQWRHAMAVAAAVLPVHVQGAVKLVLTRGREGSSDPTAWVSASVVNGPQRERHEGVRVVTLDRGLSTEAARLPWLLAGAKTLSYAVNMAALREARRRGADDVVFVSSDGFVLEGPTSSVLARFGDRIVTPDPGIGILAGTSQSSAFDFFGERGLTTEYVRLPVEELQASDALWLVSSVRLAAPVTSLDGVPHPMDATLSAALNDWLLARRE